MRFYTKQHPFSCGIDVQARSRDGCILRQDGAILVHRNMPAGPDPFRKALAPSREDRVVCGACLFTWSWLAELCAQARMPLVLGQARSMPAIHGGKATNAKSDAHKMAVLRRGGMLPQASGYPAARRATRDRLRRRPLRRKRAERLAHVQHTKSHDTLPEIGTQIASPANRDGVAARLPAPAVHKRIAVALALMDYDDQRLPDLARPIVHTAQEHDANTLSRLRALPGVGHSLALGMRSAIHERQRFPRVQDGGSSCRLGPCAQASAGQRDGTSGKKSGHASLPWAVSEAALLGLRTHDAGHKALARLAQPPGTGQALTRLAPPLARAVYYMLKRAVACARATCLHGARRGVGAPGGALDDEGMRLSAALCTLRLCVCERTEAPRPTLPEPSALRGHSRPLLERRGGALTDARGLPLLRTCPSLAPPAGVSHAYAADGTRVQHDCSAAEMPSHGTLPSPYHG